MIDQRVVEMAKTQQKRLDTRVVSGDKDSEQIKALETKLARYYED